MRATCKCFRRIGRWRKNLFWRLLTAMLLASCAGAVLVICATSLTYDRLIDNALHSADFERRLHDDLERSVPLLDDARDNPGLCRVVLRNLAIDALSAAMLNTRGANGIMRADEEGRIRATYRWADGHTCTYSPPGVSAALFAEMDAASAQWGTAPLLDRVRQSNGWIRVAGLRSSQDPGGALVIGAYVLSPIASLLANKDISWRALALYILGINSVSVLTLVPLLVKRIERAQRTSAAWTGGDLKARINDRGDDEFGRLTESFDQMADALAGVIEVKQALAAADERNRLASDLHDTAKQRAFALGLQLAALKNLPAPPPQFATIAAASVSLISHLQQDLASVITRFSGPTIAETGFRWALSDGIQTLLAGSAVEWHLRIDAQEETALEAVPETARQLLLISLEAAANTLKHAGAANLRLSGERIGQRFIWCIADDGRGFNLQSKASTGMGLTNMRSRANGLRDGKFSLSSDPRSGTVTTIEFSL